MVGISLAVPSWLIAVVAVVGCMGLIIAVNSVWVLGQVRLNQVNSDLSANQIRVDNLTERATVLCHEKGFYDANFVRCEDLGIRP